MIIRQRPPYKHLTQKKNFCGPTCLQMVLFRRGVFVGQEKLALDLGVNIDQKDTKLYVLPFKAFPSTNPEVGFRFVHFKRPETHAFMRSFGLRIRAFHLSDVDDPKKLVIENLRRGQDVIMNFWLKPIDGRNNGHYVLVSEYNPETDEVTVCDPSPEKPSTWKEKLTVFVEAMNKKWDGQERGFVVVK